MKINFESMKRYIFVLVLVPVFCFSQSPQKGFNLESAIAFPLQTTSAINTFDQEGNIYVLCDYVGSINVGSKILKSTYGISYDKLLIKYNSNLEMQWAQSFSTTSNNGKSSITTDSNNNIYVAGNYDNNSFQFGKYNLPNKENQSGKNIFLMKFNPSGDVAWVHTIGGIGDDFCTSIKTDKNNNIVIAGNFSNELNFDGTSIKSKGKSDMFIAKYDTDGGVKWVKYFGGEGNEFLNEVAIDLTGNIYITGGFYSAEVFIENTKLENEDATNRSDNSKIIIAKFDESGNNKWAKTSGGFAMTMGNSICLNNDSEVFVTGYFFKSDVIFENSSLTYHNEMGLNNPLFLKLTDAGQVQWTRSSKDENLSTGNSVAADKYGYVYFLGNFNSKSIQFDNKKDSLSLIINSSHGSEDIFIAKYDSKGNFIFANKIGGTSDDWSNCLTTDNNGILYISGTFQSSELFLINRGPLKKFNTDERYSSAFICKIWSLPESITGSDSEIDSEGKEKAIQDSITQSKTINTNSISTIEVIATFESSWESPEDELSSVVFKSLDGKALYFKLSNSLENKNVFCNYNLTEEEKTEKSNVGKKYTIYYIPKNNIEGSMGEINLFKEIK